ncbi:MAG: type II toxin-antitoxin system PemK/MazF family toxin [Thermodesulfobacteriota bacterium]|nr:type II toxin-antitoxin system PemK/MazF family toxin [Thermodesulfobacteriota bacterium]
MTVLKKGMIIDVNLEPTLGSETGKVRPCVIVTNDVYNERVPVIQVVPITEWNVKKARIITNVEIYPSKENGLSKKSVADCLQTRPIDYRHRLVKIRGKLSSAKVQEIDKSFKFVFELN